MSNATPDDAPPVTQSDRAELAELLRAFAERSKQRVHAAVVEHGLTPPLFGALNSLQQPRAMGEVADTLACDASYVTGLADRLEAMGLAERRADPDDRRVKQLVLTEQGRQVRSAVRSAMGSTYDIIPELDDDDVRDLTRLLRKILG
jgi:DNA-binding MarR family transcriptional regulator